MKNVYFDNLNSTGNRILAGISIIFLIIYFYTTFNLEGSIYQKVSAIAGFGLFIVFLGKQFFFRNYLGWNKKGIVLKLNSFFSKTISFHQISSYNIDRDQLEITRADGSIFKFKLKDIRKDHIDRIQEIISSYAIQINN